MGGLNNFASEKISQIFKHFNLPTTNDLESATKTISATSEPSGIGNATYSASMTLPAISDARINIKNLAARLATTIDSMTAGHLYCKVYVDVQDANHLLFSEDWTTTGEKLDATDLNSGNKATIFSLLGDGNAHTFYVFCWVDANNAVVSVMQLWEGVGTCTTGYVNVLELTHSGYVSVSMVGLVQGTGAVTMLMYEKTNSSNWGSLASSVYGMYLCNTGIKFYLHGTVTTDICYFNTVELNLRTMS